MSVAVAVGDRQVIGRIHLKPSGDHLLEISLGYGGELLLTHREVAAMEKLFANFKTECRFDDGRVNDRVNQFIKPLGSFQ